MMSTRLRTTTVIALVLALGGLSWIFRDRLVAWGYLLTMESDWRVQKLQVERVVRVLSLQPRQTVADIGAGTGLFSRAFARAVAPEGVVYAVDVNRDLLEHIAETAAAKGISNLRTIEARADDPLLPEPVDLVFLCDTFHHIDNRGGYLKILRRYLKPNGRIALIDYRENSPHIDAALVPGMYYTSKQLRSWLEAARFELVAKHDFLEDAYFWVYQCPTCPDTLNRLDSTSKPE